MGLFRWKAKKIRPRCAAIVVAAGNSTRMGEDKILMLLQDEPVIVHTVRALENSTLIDEIVIVTRPALIVSVAQACKDFG